MGQIIALWTTLILASVLIALACAGARAQITPVCVVARPQITVVPSRSATVEISGQPSVTNGDPFDVTITFSRPLVTRSPDECDIIVKNGSASNPQLVDFSKRLYTTTITPNGMGDVSFFVREGQVHQDLISLQLFPTDL